jgi:hypothetical protein
MDALLFARYRRTSGGSSLRDWEFSAGMDSWEKAPAPAQVGKRFVEGVFETVLPDTLAPLVNNVTHWAMGMFADAQTI